MRLTAKDGVATLLTALVVLTFFATHEGWNVWLVGDSHRWATGAIGVLGVMTCALGRRGTGIGTTFLTGIGTVALVLFVLALVTGSLTPLSLLVVAIVVLWIGATVRHAMHLPHHPMTA